MVYMCEWVCVNLGANVSMGKCEFIYVITSFEINSMNAAGSHNNKVIQEQGSVPMNLVIYHLLGRP